MKNKFCFLLMLTLFSFSNIHSQNLGADSLSINSQFNEVIDNSNSYQQYKVIELVNMQDLQENVVDTLTSLYAKIVSNEKVLQDLNSEIQSLESKMGELDSELNTTIEEKNSVLFLGMPIEKASFKFIFWAIIIFLLLALLFFIYKYYNSQKVTVESKRELMEAHKELEEQRRRHIKKEQEIMRQLQDELNKNNR